MLINHQSLRLDAATLRTSTIRKDLLRRKSSRLHPISCSSTFITQNNRMRQSKLNQIHREDMTAGMLGDLNYFISPTSHLYDNFLNFTTAEHQSKALHEEYRTFKRSGFNIQMTLFVAFLNAGYFASRGSIQHLWNLRRLHPLFLIGFTCGISAIMFIGIALFNRLAILSDAYGIKCLQPYKTGAVQRMKTQRSQLIEDIIVILVAFSQSLYLLGRTLEGECSDNSTLFDSQECNPQATSHALPQDQLVYLFIGVLFIQVFLKGASKYAILLSWMINIVFVNVSLWIVGSDQYVWLNVSLLLCLSLSYEVERSTLCMFLERKICIKTMINNAATEKVVGKLADQRDSVNRVNIELQGTIINSAHDMKSPCTALSLGIESLLKSMAYLQHTAPTEGNKENLSLVRGMSLTLASMGMTINRAMDFAKVTCGIQLTPTVSVIDLMCSVKQIVEYVSWEENMLSESIGIEYDFDINYKLEKGITDLTWFTENIFCLITNAVKYSIHPGGIRIAIKTIFIGTENYATFSVQDSGVSLSTKKLELLFDPPLQGHRSQEGGMGLGLVCLAERVTALGGTYGACLRTDQMSGTVIWFRIPFPNPNTMDGMKSRKSMSATPTEIGSLDFAGSSDQKEKEPAVSGLRILVVDDSVTILKMMVFILKKAGAHVSQCKNGREAVEKTKEVKFDIIITDIQMPILDGYAASREIRDLEKFHSIKPKIIIGISACSDAERCEEAVAAGMDGFLIKPFRLIDLIKVVKEYAANEKLKESRKFLHDGISSL